MELHHLTGVVNDVLSVGHGTLFIYLFLLID
jgi:hypothetical protein